MPNNLTKKNRNEIKSFLNRLITGEKKLWSVQGQAAPTIVNEGDAEWH